LALLVFGHRGKLDKITALPPGDANWRLLLALRLAVLLHRPRDGVPLPAFRIRAQSDGFLFELQSDWLGAHPLTALALDEEIGAWAKAGLQLRVKQRNLANEA
jgi:exopolyphosphatase/guanosine-5'-triphosphate,3'-diphosphate pyrophosphatase